MHIVITYPDTPFTDATLVQENSAVGMPADIAREPMNREEIIRQALCAPQTVMWDEPRVKDGQGTLVLTYSGIMPLAIKRTLNQLAVRNVITEWREQVASPVRRRVA